MLDGGNDEESSEQREQDPNESDVVTHEESEEQLRETPEESEHKQSGKEQGNEEESYPYGQWKTCLHSSPQAVRQCTYRRSSRDETQSQEVTKPGGKQRDTSDEKQGYRL